MFEAHLTVDYWLHSYYSHLSQTVICVLMAVTKMHGMLKRLVNIDHHIDDQKAEGIFKKPSFKNPRDLILEMFIGCCISSNNEGNCSLLFSS